MRNYLENFFRKYSYDVSDADFLTETYLKIEKNPETIALWNKAMSLYDESKDCDFAEIIAISDEVASKLHIREYTTNLLVYICLSKRAEAYYKEMGISDEIFFNSMCDLKYKLNECKLVKGIIGTFVAAWFRKFFNLSRFALGRLQFEIVDFGGEYNNNGYVLRPDSKVINVHIPRTGTPLDPESLDEAFDKAKEFFGDMFEGECPFVCRCWLLFPENEKIIPEHTNIYKFMKRFDIFESGTMKDDLNLWRLFDTDEKNYNRLPQDTSVRRAYVEHLKNGGSTGWGSGVFFR